MRGAEDSRATQREIIRSIAGYHDLARNIGQMEQRFD
jgi:hypothetical protein